MSACHPSTAASASSTSWSKCQARLGAPFSSAVIFRRRQEVTRRLAVITPIRAAIFSLVL
ncbi:hypothetical protein ADK52_22580 [Streptomyces sp. WM6372]|nr:hypothetical protein ADK52_22580 [Streptomyces sp. WM6372]